MEFDELKIVYKSSDNEHSYIKVFRRNGRGYQPINRITKNATDLYNTLIGNNSKENNTIKDDFDFKEELLDGINFDLANRIEETKDYIIAYTDFGKKVYSKRRLAKFWLTHSNDLFFKTFGFNWAPSSSLQNSVRQELTNIELFPTITFFNFPCIPHQVLEDVIKSIDAEEIIKRKVYRRILK